MLFATLFSSPKISCGCTRRLFGKTTLIQTVWLMRLEHNSHFFSFVVFSFYKFNIAVILYFPKDIQYMKRSTSRLPEKNWFVLMRWIEIHFLPHSRACVKFSLFRIIILYKPPNSENLAIGTLLFWTLCLADSTLLL